MLETNFYTSICFGSLKFYHWNKIIWKWLTLPSISIYGTSAHIKKNNYK